MYTCNCGYQDARFDWCPDCKKILKCDCVDVIRTKVRELEVSYENGSRSISVYVEICSTCGSIKSGDVEY